MIYTRARLRRAPRRPNRFRALRSPSGHPRSGARITALSAEQPVRSPNAREDIAVATLEQLQCPPDPLGRRQDLHHLFAPRGREERPARDVSRLPFCMKVLLENLLRFEDGRTVTKADIEAIAAWLDNTRQGREGDRLPPGPRADAGLHRRAGGRRSRRHARRHEDARRRPAQDQPAGAGRPRHRPLGHRRRVRHAAGASPRTSSSNTSATASATGS